MQFLEKFKLILIGGFSLVLLFLLIFSQSGNTTKVGPKTFHFHYPKVKVLTTTYYAHRWSDIGRYKRVSKKGKRLGNFVAINFLPGGSIVMIPELFQTTTFEVADTFGGSGIGVYKGKKYWKVDILRNKNEWHDDFDHPLDLYVVKYNKNGPVKNAQVKRNCMNYQKKLK